MLDRLQQMLRNCQAGLPMQQDRQGNQAQQMMNDLGKKKDDASQQQLLEQSYQMQRGQQQGQQQGEASRREGQGQQGDGGLQAAQQDCCARTWAR